jgi:outer membrane protein assembly factor BamB
MIIPSDRLMLKESNQTESLSENPKKELLHVWPSNGPGLSWEYEGIGNGYSSPVNNSEYIFVNGEIDSTGFLFALNLKGELKWKKAYGNEWTNNYPGSRASPAIYKNLVFVCSAFGELTCFEAATGEKKWSLNIVKDLNGKMNNYGYSSKLLIYDDVLYCLPGGKEANIAALDCFTGKTIWISKGKGETSGYGNAIIVELPLRKILVCFSEFSLMGIDIKTGNLLWSKELDLSGELPCNTPLYENGFLYYVAGPGNGAAKLRLSEDGTAISQIWRNIEFDTFFGGFVKYGNYLYSSINSKNGWTGIDTQTGEMGVLLKLKKGAIVEAEGLLYCYNESGEVFLIEPDKGNLKVRSSFKVSKGTKEHFAHPVIESGTLLIRHGNTLLAYNIKS